MSVSSFPHAVAVVAAAANPLAMNISPNPFNESDPACPFTGSNINSNPSGGAGGYTFLWEKASGLTGVTINNSTSQSCSLTTSSGGSRTGTLKCTVTDADTDSVNQTINADIECGGT